MRPQLPTPDLVGAPPTLPTPAADVPVLRWPADATLRHGLAAVGCPRLLVVDPGVAPPPPVDQLEDWVRWPAHPDDVATRSDALRQRTVPPPPMPELDADGLLRRGRAWVAVSEAQLPVLRLLVDHFGRVVPMPRIVDAYTTGGGTPKLTSVRTALSRLGARIAPLGLELTTVRRRGTVLRDLTADRRPPTSST